jgi:hypothetical protein
MSRRDRLDASAAPQTSMVGSDKRFLRSAETSRLSSYDLDVIASNKGGEDQ